MGAFTVDPTHTPSPWTDDAPRKQRDLNSEYHAHRAVDCLKGGLWLTEKMPTYHINPGSGLGMLLILAGYEYEYHGNTAWLGEQPGLLEQDPPEWDMQAPKVRQLEECYRCAREAIGDMGFLSSPNLLDPITVLSQLAGAESLAMGLIEQPEQVQRWIDALTELYLYTFEHFSELTGTPDSDVFFGPVVDGAAAALQCDFSVMLSPTMFEKFVLPVLQRIAEQMPMTLYHLDGVEQMRFLDLLRQIPSLRGIQWNPQQDYFRPSRHLADLKTIREKGFVLYVAVESVEEAEIVTHELGPDGLYIRFRDMFQTEDEIRQAEQRLKC
jgi:5-methyltetrahydrofolate--homocysteine methyltransferase